MFQLFQLLINKHINSYSKESRSLLWTHFLCIFYAFFRHRKKETYKASPQSRELHEEEEEADKKKHETITCLWAKGTREH